MPIAPAEIIDYRSSNVNSDGGTITATKLKLAQLSAAILAGAIALPVYDSAGIVNEDTGVIDNGTNKEALTVNGTPTATSIPVTATVNGYAKDTPFGIKQNLIPNITAAQSEAGLTLYRKFFRRNTNASLVWANPRNYINNQVENAALSFGFGLDHADDTDGAQGNMTALAADDTIQVLSDGADTRTVTINGLRASDGAAISEVLTLNGTTAVTSSNTFKAGGVYRAFVSALNAARTVTIRRTTGAVALGAIGINKRVCWLWFGKRITAGSIVNAEGGDAPGGGIIDATNSILFQDVAAAGAIPFWLRYMVAAGSAAAGNSTGVVATKGETT
jgi:hypothetical protein